MTNDAAIFECLKARSLRLGLLGALLAGSGAAGAARGQTAPAPAASAMRSESQYAWELLHLRQMSLIEGQLAAARGTAAENLWRAQWLQSQYDESTKDPAAAAGMAQQYLAALAGYIQSQEHAGGAGGLDGIWALDHAQFILAHLAQPILTRMEYFSNNPRDRAALAPLAAAAEQLLRIAGQSLEGAMKRMEAAKPFDEKGYEWAFWAAADARFYTACTQYFQAMALDPGAGAGGDGARKKLLAQAVEGLAEWAVEAPDNRFNFQAYLVRGKAESEAGDYARALADFAKAQGDKAPAWVQYQGRYQTVVVHLRAGDFFSAQNALETLRKSIAADNAEGLISADMLGYRVAWAVAENRTSVTDRRRAERDALDILGGIIQRDGRYRDLVYEQLAAQIPENAGLSGLFPMQQLALARTTSLNQRGDTAESRRQLTLALRAAEAVQTNPQANNPEKLEALFLQGVCNALLGNLAAAAGFEIDFATQAPKDPRARQVVDLALQQIGELRKAAATQRATAPNGDKAAEELRALAARALELSTNTFGDRQWLFAQGRLLEEAGKAAEAAAVYEKIEPTDRNYLDARYRLVALATERFDGLKGKAPAREQQAAATALFAACTEFIGLLDHPPAGVPPPPQETLQAAQENRASIWLIETATALSPAVKNLEVATDRIARLEAVRAKLTAFQRDSLLRFKIEALQLAGQPDKARQVLEEYRKSGPEALANIRTMALQAVEQIDQTTDPAEIQRQANSAVMLLEAMITAANEEGKKENAFEYREIQAEMMTRAGMYQESQALALQLQKEKGEDLRPFLSEARSIFAQAQATKDARLYAKAQDYFTRILARLTPGSETFWEVWLRIVQAMEAQSAAPSAEIKVKLGDLKAVYGKEFGGTRWREEFGKLAGKYGVK